MPTRIEIHEDAIAEIGRLGHPVQSRIRRALYELEKLDNPRDRLVAYRENLVGFWKLRIGDYRLVCELRWDDRDNLVVVIHVVHRSKAYLARSVKTVRRRTTDR